MIRPRDVMVLIFGGDHQHPLTPEQRLARAIIEAALLDLHLESSTRKGAREAFLSAWAFFFEVPEDRSRFGFQYLADHVDLDTAALREAILRDREERQQRRRSKAA